MANNILNMNTLNSILLIIYEDPDFERLLDISAALRPDFKRVNIFSPYALPRSSEFKTRSKEKGYSYVEATSSKGAFNLFLSSIAAINGKVLTTSQSKLSQKFEQCCNVDVRQESLWKKIYHETIKYRLQKLVYREILKLLEVDVIILAEDNIERDSSIWGKAASEVSVPSVVYNSSVVVPGKVAQAYQDNKEHHVNSLIAKLFTVLYPNWIWKTVKGPILRLPLQLAVARVLSRTAVEYPWYLNTGIYNVLATETEQSKAMFIQYKVKDNHIVIVGSPRIDRLIRVRSSENERNLLLRTIGIENALSPVVIVSPPKNYYPDFNYPAADTYRDLLSKFNVILKSCDGNVLIAPHPAIADADLEQFEFPIVKHRTVELIAIGDVYITAPSSTIRWSNVVNTPTIVFDPYNFEFGEHLGANTDHWYTNLEDLAMAILTLRQNPSFMKNSRTIERSIRSDSLERFKNLVEGMVKENEIRT